MWGLPSGWDSAPSESHHKIELKAPSKNTQRNTSTLIEQTAIRQLQNNTLICTNNYFDLEVDNDEVGGTKINPVSSSKFTIKVDNNSSAVMAWDDIHYNKVKPTHPDDVLEYI